MPYEYKSKEELEQYIQEVKHMLVGVEDTMKRNTISWKDILNLYLFRMHVVEKLSIFVSQPSNFLYYSYEIKIPSNF